MCLGDSDPLRIAVPLSLYPDCFVVKVKIPVGDRFGMYPVTTVWSWNCCQSGLMKFI